MKYPTQETPARKFSLKDLGPAMITIACLLVLATALPAASAPPAKHYTFMTVDAPGKDLTNGFQLTWIGNDGLVIQQYADAGGHSHTAALLNSEWTLIDVPGAANTGGTNPNSRGEVALSYWEDDFIFHLAIWERGHYTYVPDSAFDGYAFQGAQGINDRGEVSAAVGNADGSILYGWVGDRRHHTIFGYPGADFTIAFMTNNSGTTVGEYVDDAGAGHGFLKTGDHFENLDYPGGSNTFGLSINNSGEVVGDYFLSHVHGFLLQRDRLTPFNVPGAIAESPYWINDHHVIAGSYKTLDGNWHGFIATPVGGK